MESTMKQSKRKYSPIRNLSEFSHENEVLEKKNNTPRKKEEKNSSLPNIKIEEEKKVEGETTTKEEGDDDNTAAAAATVTKNWADEMDILEKQEEKEDWFDDMAFLEKQEEKEKNPTIISYADAVKTMKKKNGLFLTIDNNENLLNVNDTTTTRTKSSATLKNENEEYIILKCKMYKETLNNDVVNKMKLRDLAINLKGGNDDNNIIIWTEIDDDEKVKEGEKNYKFIGHEEKIRLLIPSVLTSLLGKEEEETAAAASASASPPHHHHHYHHHQQQQQQEKVVEEGKEQQQYHQHYHYHYHYYFNNNNNDTKNDDDATRHPSSSNHHHQPHRQDIVQKVLFGEKKKFGVLIGKRHQNISKIEKDYNVKIQVPTETDPSNVITIKGNDIKNVTNAVNYVTDVLESIYIRN